MLPNLSSLQPAVEMIDFQKDDFGAKLESLVSQVLNVIKEDKDITADVLAKQPIIKEIEALIYKRMGLKVDFETHTALAAIMPFYSNKNHVFIQEYFRGGFSITDQDKLLKNTAVREGSVDLERAKLGGIFSEYTNDIYIHFHTLFLELKMSPAEVTAVILHELGHGFAVCEYSDRLESMNQALANVANEVLSKGKKKDLNYIYRELSKVNKDVKEEEIEELLNGDRVIAGAKWFKLVIGTVKAQLGNSKYDETAFEYLADNFASRFGYGKQLILGLDKLHVAYGDPSKSKTDIKVLQFMSFVALVAFTAIITSVLFTAAPIGVLYAVLFGFVLRSTGEDGKDYTYDELKVRYLRVRQDMVEKLKDNAIPKDKLKLLLEDLYLMDNIIKETHQWSTIFSKLSNFVFTSNRRAQASIQEQEMLESLISNDLFVQAARLKLA